MAAMTPEEFAEMKRPISNGPQALWTLREQKQTLLAEVQRLQKRLKAAEDVCVMFGWSAADMRNVHERATHQVWRRWVAMAGSGFLDPGAHPDLSAEEQAKLAAECDETRARILKASL